MADAAFNLDEDGDDDAIDASAFIGVDRALPRITKFLKDIVDNPDQQQGLDITLLTSAQSDVRQEKAFATIPHDLSETKISETVDEILRLSVDDMDSAQYVRRRTYVIRVEGVVKCLKFVLERPVKRGEESGSQVFPDNQGALQLVLDQCKTQGDQILKLSNTVVEMAAQNQTGMLAIVNRQDTQLARHEKMEFDRANQMHRLIVAGEERGMILEDFRREQDRKDKFAEGFKAMGPPIVAAALGPQAGAALAMMNAMTNGAPEVTAAAVQTGASETGGPIDDANIIDALVQSLERSPEKLQAVLKGLDASDVALFAELHKRSSSRADGRRSGGGAGGAAGAGSGGEGKTG